MTCKDCIHSGLCYKENDFDNFPDRCGSFISDKVFNNVLEERPQGEWIKQYGKSYELKTNEGVLVGEFTKCPKCQYDKARGSNFCPNCGADMRPKPNHLRDCENCVHHSDNGCGVWECEFKRRSS